ncbi:hypothetical protein [Bacillus smithii]|uniref:hypothetical protein n=1 Tax=Bacillus smithii TaxID=1479 RepID=UPI0030C9BDA0
MQGYIKDHRKELNSDIWMMPPLYHRVWQYLKYQANYIERYIPMSDGSKLLIKKGQHLTSIRKIARGVGYYEKGLWHEPNPKTIDTILKWMEKNNMITIDRGNRQYTLITILNWDLYQATDEDKETADDDSKTPKAPKKKKSAVKYPEDSTYYKMAQYFYQRVAAVAKAEGLSHLIIKADLQKWADDMRKLIEIDKVDKRLARDVMDWVTTDSFWKTNVLSAKKLRDKFSELAIRMNASQKPKQSIRQQRDPRDKEIEFARWVQEGNDPDEFDWGK